jgi:Neugrin
MMTVCAASRRLTLSNAIQGIYHAEVARQRLENSAVTYYNRYNRRQFLTPIASDNSWLSQRPFSTSLARASEEGNALSEGIARNNRSDGDVLTELTSTKADHTPQSSKTSTTTKKNSKSKSDSKSKFKISEKNTRKDKKIDGKSPLQTTIPLKKVKLEPWKVQKKALQEKFEEGWFPRKKLSPDTLDTIRHLHDSKPNDWTTPALANHFKVSPEAIRRILKSRWQPTEEERENRKERWHKRHERIWSRMEELGLRPPKGERTAMLSDARKLGISSAPSTPSTPSAPSSLSETQQEDF